MFFYPCLVTFFLNEAYTTFKLRIFFCYGLEMSKKQLTLGSSCFKKPKDIDWWATEISRNTQGCCGN